MNETKLGIVGCGNISSTYLKVLGELDDVEAVACADIDLARAKRAPRSSDCAPARSRRCLPIRRSRSS